MADQRRWRAAVTGVAAFVALALGASYVGSSHRFEPEELRTGSFRERAAVWRASSELAATAPALGHGIGSFPGKIWRHAPAGIGGAIEHAHSQPLEALAEKGWLGSLPFLLGLLAVLGSCVRGIREADLRGSRSGPVLRGALLASAMVPLQSLGDLPLVSPALAALAAVLLGAATGVARENAIAPHAGDAEAASPGGMRVPVLALAIAVAFTGGAWGWKTRERARSDAALAAGDADAALEHARRAVSLDPGDRVCLRRLADNGEERHALALALIDPDDPWAALGAAEALRARGKHRDAIAELERAVALYPAGYEPSRQLLEARLLRGELAASLDIARAIASQHPSRAVETTLRLADALDDPLIAEELAPDEPQARQHLARYLVDRGWPDGVLRLLEHGRAAGGGSEAGYESTADIPRLLLIARAQAAAGRQEAAREALREARRLDPAGVPAAVALAALSDSQTSRQEAEIGLRQAANASPDEGASTHLLGLLDADGRSAEADAWLDEQLSRRPFSTSLLLLRIGRRERNGDEGGAMEDAQRLIELRPRDPAGYMALARIYDRRGLDAGARDLRARVLRLDPGNREARERLEAGRADDPREASTR